MKEEVLRFEDVVYTQRGVRLLDGCTLRVCRGEALGVMLTNAYRRSALMDILRGLRPFDGGRVYLDDQPMDAQEFARSSKSRVAWIGAQSKLIDRISVAENIFVIRGGFRKYLISMRTLELQAARLLERFAPEISPRASAGRLSAYQRSVVELLKAVATGARFVILIDLSRYLSNAEVEAFHRLVAAYKAEGVAFMVVDSYLDVLLRHCDRLTLLNAGRVARTFERRFFDESRIALMLTEEAPRGAAPAVQPGGEPVLELRGVRAGALREVSLTLRAGQSVGLLDIDGAATADLLRLLSGELRPERGALLLGGKRYAPRGLHQAVAMGVCVVEENPTERMLFVDEGVMQNLALSLSHKAPDFWRRARYQRSLRGQCVELLGEEVADCQDLRLLDAETLQKLVYVKWLLYAPRVLVCVKPFSVIDPYLRGETQRLIRRFTERGVAVLVLTTNRTEARLAADQVYEMEAGRLKGGYRA